MSTRTFPEIGDDETSVGTVDCSQKSVKVFVDGIEIPTVDSSEMRDDEGAVEVQVRTDGPADITRLSDIYFPAYWRGESVFDALPFDEDVNMSVPVTIQARRPPNSTVGASGGTTRTFPEIGDNPWITIHSGWLRKIGSGGDGRLLRMRVSDYANIAGNTPITNTWKNTDVGTVVDEVIETLDEKNRMPSVSLNVTSEQLPETGDDVGETGVSSIDYFITGQLFVDIVDTAFGQNTKSKTFQAVNGDTVADVLNWVTDITDTIWFFSPVSRDSVSLNIIPRSQIETLFETRQAGGDVYVHKNQALFNIDPINQVTVIGEKMNTDVEVPDALYLTATASHGQLIQNAGGSRNTKVIRDSVASAEAAENLAVKTLKQEHEHSNEGEIVVDGRPEFVPNNLIEAIPICNGWADYTMGPMKYQIKEVTHELPATGRYTTTLNVGISTTDDDISVVSGYGEGDGDVLYKNIDAAIEDVVPEEDQYLYEGDE